MHVHNRLTSVKCTLCITFSMRMSKCHGRNDGNLRFITHKHTHKHTHTQPCSSTLTGTHPCSVHSLLQSTVTDQNDFTLTSQKLKNWRSESQTYSHKDTHIQLFTQKFRICLHMQIVFCFCLTEHRFSNRKIANTMYYLKKCAVCMCVLRVYNQ